MNIDELNVISGKVLHAAIEVHRELGPGLMESVYEACLYKELLNNGLSVLKQLKVPVVYKGQEIDLDYRIDLLVENEVIIELKVVESLLPVHKAQLMTYMKLANKRLGLLINFNVRLLKDGFKRIIL